MICGPRIVILAGDFGVALLGGLVLELEFNALFYPVYTSLADLGREVRRSTSLASYLIFQLLT